MQQRMAPVMGTNVMRNHMEGTPQSAHTTSMEAMATQADSFHQKSE
jgi:hypothetical protein